MTLPVVLIGLIVSVSHASILTTTVVSSTDVVSTQVSNDDGNNITQNGLIIGIIIPGCILIILMWILMFFAIKKQYNIVRNKNDIKVVKQPTTEIIIRIKNNPSNTNSDSCSSTPNNLQLNNVSTNSIDSSGVSDNRCIPIITNQTCVQTISDYMIAKQWQENQIDMKKETMGSTDNIRDNQQIRNDAIIAEHLSENNKDIHGLTKGQISCNEFITKK